MPTKSELFLPPSKLASCISVGIFRDTTQAALCDGERVNYFPATPLCAVTRVFAGQLHMLPRLALVAELRDRPPMSSLSFTPPQSNPVSSWSPGALRAITIAFYPEAWIALGGSLDGGSIPQSVQQALSHDCEDGVAFWSSFNATMASSWNEVRRRKAPWAQWAGSHRVTDWVRHIATQSALSGTGRSIRSVERRMRRWSGQSRQSLDFFARIENLHARSVAAKDIHLADMAFEAGYSDQSHMGRAVKRATGFSPRQLNERITSEEPFWCYRLLGERF